MIYSTKLGTDNEGFRTPVLTSRATSSNTGTVTGGFEHINKFAEISEELEGTEAAATPTSAKSFIDMLREEQAKNPLLRPVLQIPASFAESDLPELSSPSDSPPGL